MNPNLARIVHNLSNWPFRLYRQATWSTGALACVPNVESQARAQAAGNKGARAPVLHFSNHGKCRDTCKESGLVICTAAMLLGTMTGWSQAVSREPHIGYLYPAGGACGKAIRITAGGQFLSGASGVHVSGEGVHATVIKYARPLVNLDKEERQELQQRLAEVRDQRLAELPESVRAAFPLQWKLLGKKKASRETPAETAAGKPGKKVNRPNVMDHPLFYDLEHKSLRELSHLVSVLTIPRDMRQQNRQLAEEVLLEIAIDPRAAPGNHELRIKTPLGLSNPLVFQVGTLPEISELEPNDPVTYPNRPDPAILDKLLPVPPLELPVLLNGQILPGDIDRFRIRARQGQQLVVVVQGRSLIPYLADAVPGWFQPTLTLSDANGQEVAFASDFRFDPDPVLFYQVPSDGEYDLEIRDALYRGRDDFVYRIAVGELPYITGIHPLGGRAGSATVAALTGWNLSGGRLSLNTQPAASGIRQTVGEPADQFFNRVPYAVDTLPEINETEPNDGRPDIQSVTLPVIANGGVGRPGDVDIFQFNGRAGEEVVAEVMARRLGSSLDSLLRLVGPDGKIVAWNDDVADKEAGLLTHASDSYLRVKLPGNGHYQVQVSDAQRHGGAEYGYRLRLSAPRPDFSLRVTPSSVNIVPGGSASIRVYALRKDGFDGEIELALKGAPEGYVLTGGRIPAGRDSIRMTVSGPTTSTKDPITLNLEGRARINGQSAERTVVPAEDLMQAFIYRHLVPSQEFLASVMGFARNLSAIQLADNRPVQIPIGGTVTVKVRVPNLPIARTIQLELDEPPVGVTLKEVTADNEGMTLHLKTDAEKIKEGFSDNLIVGVIMNREAKGSEGDTQKAKQRIALGVLPAIPITVVKQSISRERVL